MSLSNEKLNILAFLINLAKIVKDDETVIGAEMSIEPVIDLDLIKGVTVKTPKGKTYKLELTNYGGD